MNPAGIIASMSQRFYLNSVLEPGPVALRGPEAHHLAAVCRISPGERVYLFNGDGREYLAEVVSATRKQVALEILAAASPEREPSVRLLVAAPLPKGDRGHFLVEKLTELGVTVFTPLRTQRSVVHPGAARQEKLERTVIEASKQCGRNVLMRIEALTDWEAFCGRGDLPDVKVIAHPGGAPLPRLGTQDRVFAIGPEGGFAEEEIEEARAAGWHTAGLGPRTLRIETAAILLAARAE